MPGTGTRMATHAELRLIAAQSVVSQLKSELAEAHDELQKANQAVQAEREAERAALRS